MKKQDIINAYCHIRKIDNTIPDEVLDFMKESALEKLEEIEKKEANKKYVVFVPVENRRECNPYIREDGYLYLPETKEIIRYNNYDARDKARRFDGKVEKYKPELEIIK